MKRKLVSNPREICRHLSTQALALAGIVQTAWLTFPESMKADLPHGVATAISSLLLFLVGLGLYGKFTTVQQPEQPSDDEKEHTP